MIELTADQIRYARLNAHHLDGFYSMAEIDRIVGACGMQNTPPGAWETALFNRVPDCGQAEMEDLLYNERSLLQAWSLRGAPMVFPAGDSPVFLTALAAQEGEPWLYTQGIGLALDYLQMSFDELLGYLLQVMPRLDGAVIASKSELDQTLARWMLPLLPAEKRERWEHPSMYGDPDRQTVGGAVVSFLLRPCSLLGLVVFGARQGVNPTFTSYQSWTGQTLRPDPSGERELARRFLHCYGPSTADAFIAWTGCSKQQGRRIWASIEEETEPVQVLGKTAQILAADRERFLSPPLPQREWLLLGGHDPFLDQRDRVILQPDRALHKQIWKLVGNPGAIIYRGEVAGIWTSRKKGKGMEIKMKLWSHPGVQRTLTDLAEGYAAFRRQKLLGVSVEQA